MPSSCRLSHYRENRSSECVVLHCAPTGANFAARLLVLPASEFPHPQLGNRLSWLTRICFEFLGSARLSRERLPAFRTARGKYRFLRSVLFVRRTEVGVGGVRVRAKRGVRCRASTG